MKNFAAIITGGVVLVGAVVITFGNFGNKSTNTYGLRNKTDADTITNIAQQGEIKDTINNILNLDNGALKKADARAIIDTLQLAIDHGIITPDISALKAKIDADEKITDEDKATLKTAIVKYANEMNGGRINWKNVSGYWLMRPKKIDFDAEFENAYNNDNIIGFLDNLAPKHDAYLGLVGMRNRYANYVAQGDFIKIGVAPTLKAGMNNEKIALLRKRLAQEDYAAPAIPTIVPAADNATNVTTTTNSGETYFDAGLKQQLSNYQEAHNIKADGELGEATLKSLEISAKERLKQIDLNLERERWLPRDNPQTRIEANITDQHLIYWENGKKTFEMPVIVGATATKTPMLADYVHGLVFNPPWYKPASIKGSQRIQPPGPNNALGRVKFDMENGHAIYLHDTPNHSLFSARNRTFSHGCIRLHYPKDLAEILGKSQGYDRARIDKLTSTVKTVRVKLNVKTPVFLLYRTAYVDNIGGKTVVHFNGDPYSWDKVLSEILNPTINDNDKNTGKETGKNTIGAIAIDKLAHEEFSVAAP